MTQGPFPLGFLFCANAANPSRGPQASQFSQHFFQIRGRYLVEMTEGRFDRIDFPAR